MIPGDDDASAAFREQFFGGVEPPWVTMAAGYESGPDEDLGLEMLDDLISALMIDPEWLETEGRSFTWWGSPIPLFVDAQLPAPALGDATVRLSAHVVLLDEIRAAPHVVVRVVDALNANTAISPYVFDEDLGTLRSTLSVYMHTGNRSMMRIYRLAVMLHYTETVAKVPDLAKMLQARRAIRPHPMSGERSDFDDLFDFTDLAIVPIGAEANRYTGENYQQLADWYGGFELLASASNVGVTVEFPFTGGTPGVVLRMVGINLRMTSMLQLGDGPHPGYGNGLVSVLKLPIEANAEEASRLAGRLNTLEASSLTGFMSFGAWCSDVEREGNGLAHCTFWPNAFADPGVASVVMKHEAFRSQWARDVLAN